MKTPLLIALVAVVLGIGGTLIMNKACKSSHHAWCAPVSSIRHHTKTGHSQEYRSTANLLTKKQSAVNARASVTGFKRQTAIRFERTC